MIIHHCSRCQKISINRIARDDLESEILNTLYKSQNLDNFIKKLLVKDKIELLTYDNEFEVLERLFGKQNIKR